MLHRYLLVARFAVLNLVGIGLLVAVYLEGWLAGVTGATLSMTLAITAVFAFGLASCALKVWRTSVELNELREGRPSPRSRAAAHLARIAGLGPESRGILARLLQARLAAYVSVVRHTASSLVFLGLIGTVVGFIIALSGVDPEAGGDAARIAPMVATLIEGMSVALYTTLAGAVLHLWLMINHRILATGAMHLYGAIIENGERGARSEEHG